MEDSQIEEMYLRAYSDGWEAEISCPIPMEVLPL